MKTRFFLKSTLLLFVFIFAGSLASAQVFTFNSSSGGTSSLDLTVAACPAPNTDVTIDVGSTGIKEYTTISIHANCKVHFTPYGNGTNLSSKPVYLLATGNVVIDGELNLDGSNGESGTVGYQANGGSGGPGGYDGGNGGDPPEARGLAGFGPGGGNAGSYDYSAGNPGDFTPNSDNPAEQALIGGSGGGGGGYDTDPECGGGGGGGGGAIMIASSGTITINGTISAMGGSGGADTCSSSDFNTGGAGANGMVHLIANEIAGSGTVNGAYVVLETLNNSSSFTSNAGIQEMDFQQLTLDLGSVPTITITTIGGESISGSTATLSQSGSSSTSDDKTIVISSTGLGGGTQIRIDVTGPFYQQDSCTLTLPADSCNVAVFPGVNLIVAYVRANYLYLAALPTFQGEKIMYARLEATPGGKSGVVFYTESNKKVPQGFIKNPMKYARFN